MTVISIPPKQRKTAFYFGENIVTTSLIKKICQNTKTVIIMDLYFDNPSIQSMAAELNASLFTLEGGESAKTQKKKTRS